MPEAKFVLKEPSSKDVTLIFLFYRFNGNSLKYSTGQKIKPKFWNAAKQKAKISRAFPQAEKLNELLENLSRRISDAHKDFINEKTIPTIFKLKDELNKVLFKEEYAQKRGFLQFIEELIVHSSRKDNTKRQWKQTLRKLLEYQKSSKAEVDFDTINLDFYNQFVQFLTKEGYTKNTIGGFVKNIKIFMRT